MENKIRGRRRGGRKADQPMKPSEYHGCATGDCPHEYQGECVAAVLKLADELHAEVERQREIINKLPKWAESLLDGQNQLHGIRGGGMARRTMRDVEAAIHKALEETK